MESSTKELTNNYKKALTKKYQINGKPEKKKNFKKNNNNSCIEIVDSFKMLNNHPVFDKRLDLLNVDVPIQQD
jgi:hypothetical protein